MADTWWRVSPAMGDAAARELIYRIGGEYFIERALLAWSRSEASAHDEAWRELATLPERWSAPTFPLRAADFIARGMEKGPVLGSALARSEEMWIREGFPLARKALDRIVNEALGG
jgi:poly(A) polymerase